MFFIDNSAKEVDLMSFFLTIFQGTKTIPVAEEFLALLSQQHHTNILYRDRPVKIRVIFHPDYHLTILET